MILIFTLLLESFFALNRGASLPWRVKYAKGRFTCNHESTGLVMSLQCGRICHYMVDMYRGPKEYFEISSVPSTSRCNVDFGVEYYSFKEKYTGEHLTTIWRNASDDSTRISKSSKISVNDEFCACVSSDLTGKNESGELISRLIWVDDEEDLKVHNLRQVSLTVWDLSGKCYDRWFFKLSDHPLGYSPESKSLFANQNKCQSLWSSNTYNDPVHEMVNIHYKQSFILDIKLNDDFAIKSFPEYKNKHSCVEKCNEESFQFSTVSLNDCRCFESDRFLSSPVLLSKPLKKINPCSDKKEKSCGALDNQPSIYPTDILPSANTFGFRFWHCIKRWKYSPIKSVFRNAEDLFVSFNKLDSPSSCLKKCHEFRNQEETIVIFSFDPIRALVNCHCISLAFYKFRRLEITRECFNVWCPDIRGPCSKSKDVEAVYCRGAHCNEDLFLEKESVSICAPPFYVASPSEKDIYYICHNSSKIGFTWEKTRCAENETFNPNELACFQDYDTIRTTEVSTHRRCIAVDGRGTQWNEAYNTVGKQGCGEFDELAFAYWECGDEGKFLSEEPNRIDCVDMWIADMANPISPTQQNAINATMDFLEKLSSSNIYGGSLMKAPNILYSIVSLQVQQFTNRTREENVYFTHLFFGVLDNILHNQALAWLELPEILQRRNAYFEILYFSEMSAEVLFRAINIDGGDCAFSETMGSFTSRFMVNITSHRMFNPTKLSLTFSGYDAEIYLPLNNEALFDSGEKEKCFLTYGSTSSFKYIGNLLTPSFNENGSFLGQTLLTFSVSAKEVLRYPVKITFRNPDLHPLKKCIFWDSTFMEWNEEGCRVINVYGPKVSCYCDHLTSIGVLFGSKSPRDPLKRLLSISLGITSCIALFMTQVFLHINYSKSRGRASKYVIELNRNYCLIIGEITLLFVVDLKETASTLTCKLIALWTEYIWSSVFFWFWLEGRLLYRVLVVVINAHHMDISDLYLIGYGIPLLSVTLTLISAVHFRDDDKFVRPDVCWLEDKYTIGFFIPLGLVFVWNFYVLFKGAVITYEHCRKQRDLTKYQKFNSWIRSGVTLSYLLGVPWFFGYFTKLDETFEYVFIFVSSISGIVIFFNTIRVIEVFQKFFGWSSFRNSNSASTSRLRRGH